MYCVPEDDVKFSNVSSVSLVLVSSWSFLNQLTCWLLKLTQLNGRSEFSGTDTSLGVNERNPVQVVCNVCI